MNQTNKTVRRFFDSARVSKAVGMPPIYLNKFIERRKYGIKPSLLSSKGRGSRRVFDENDVYGIGLVWWLFEAGLRSDTIQDVLNEICRTIEPAAYRTVKKAAAKEAAFILREVETDVLAIQREPRIGLGSGPQPKPEVVLVHSEEGFEHLLANIGTESLLYVPTGNLFRMLKVSIEKFGVSVGKG